MSSTLVSEKNPIKVKKYKIWYVDKYNKTTQWIKNNAQLVTLAEVKKMLSENSCYHMRSDGKNKYTFFGDCDKFRGSYEEFEALLIEFMKKFYKLDIELDDISYTINYSVEGSFHYSIPKYNASAEKLVEIMENFRNEYKCIFIYTKQDNKKQNVIDVDIYKNRFFRLPNQKKENVNGSEHVIQRGNPLDFFADYIKKDSICIDDVEFISNKSIEDSKKSKIKNITIEEISENFDDIESVNGILSKEDCKKLLEGLSENRCDDRTDWINVGQILKNHSDGNTLFEVWKKWSQKSNKYIEGCCETQWKSFKKMKNGIKLGTLLKMIKEDNSDKFKSIQKHLKIKNIITKNKDNFPDNDLQIDQIVTGNNSHYIDLLDKYCPIKQDNHDDRYNYMELSKYGDLVLKCRCSSCRGKEYPDYSIQIPNNELKCLFNFTHIENLNINFNDNDVINSDKIKIPFDTKIFPDDDVLNKLILDSLNGTDYKMSKVIFHLAKDKFRCCKNKKWFEFNKHRWIESEKISDFISDNIVIYYNKLIKFVTDSKNIDKNDKTITIKEIRKIVSNLESNDIKTKILNETGRKFRSEFPTFYDELDTIPFILGFNNGVYDLKKMEFRNGVPEDLISMTCGYDYTPTYSENYNDLQNFLDDILPIVDDKEYLLKYISTGLLGINMCELFTVLSGKGRNGKSKFVELCAHTLGDYFGRPKCKLLTGSRPDENAPEPGLLSLKRKRTIIVSEPEKNDKLNSGFIKFITGNDSEALRKCHQNEMEMFKANFITLLVCNDIPEIDNIDIAFVKRLRCVNFPTEFINNPSLPHQKQIDETLQTKIVCWKHDFFLLLLEYYKKFNIEKLNPPQNVLEWTNTYKEEVDKYYIFLEECTEQSEEHISNVKLYDRFKQWFRDRYPGEKLPNNREFIAGLRKYKNVEKGVKINGKSTPGVKHLKLKDTNEE